MHVAPVHATAHRWIALAGPVPVDPGLPTVRTILLPVVRVIDLPLFAPMIRVITFRGSSPSRVVSESSFRLAVSLLVSMVSCEFECFLLFLLGFDCYKSSVLL